MNAIFRWIWKGFLYSVFLLILNVVILAVAGVAISSFTSVGSLTSTIQSHPFFTLLGVVLVSLGLQGLLIEIINDMVRK